MKEPSARDLLDEARASGSGLRIAEAELEGCIRAEQSARARILTAREILASPALKERHKAAKADLDATERELEGITERRAFAHDRYAKMNAEHTYLLIRRQQSLVAP